MCSCSHQLTSSFIRKHTQTRNPTTNTPNLSRLSLPLSNPLYLTPERSDNGLTPSTHRLAINTGFPVPPTTDTLFGPGAKSVHLPALNSHLTNLKPTSFTPWSETLTQEEIVEYQTRNHRKFPIFHRLQAGVSISELKSNVTKRVLFPGLENDLWRFVVDVCILTAGSPYGRDLSVGVFHEYTQFVISIIVRDKESPWRQRILNYTGGGSLGLVISLVLVLLLLYKCRKTEMRNRRSRQRIMVWEIFQFSHSSQGFEGYHVTTCSSKDRLGVLLTMVILIILYIPISKFAIDSLTWNSTLMQGNSCYRTNSEGFNWVSPTTSRLKQRQSSSFPAPLP